MTAQLFSGQKALEPPGRSGAVLHLLGGPFVCADGCRREVPEGSKKLLVFVALRRRRVERRHAAGVLWPEGSDERAAGNLRSALWRLRGADIDLLDVDKASLRLRDDVAVDIEAIGNWSGRLINGTVHLDELTLAPFWTETIEFLPGWYDDWVLLERERLRQRMLHGLESLSRQLIAADRFAEAVEAAMLAVALEPLRESAQRVLVTAHLAEGNQVEGLRCFDAYRELLFRELGVEPATELAELVRAGARGSCAPDAWRIRPREPIAG